MPLGDIDTYRSGAVLESRGEQQFQPRESQVRAPQRGAAHLGEEGRISTFQVQSFKVRASQQCKLFGVRTVSVRTVNANLSPAPTDDQ